MANTTGRKFGGRQKGTANKRTKEFMDLYDVYAEQHGDPMLTLFQIQGDKEIEPSLRLRAAADLLPYRYPKRKAVELAIEDNQSVKHLPMEEATRRIEELLGPAGASEKGRVNAE